MRILVVLQNLIDNAVKYSKGASDRRIGIALERGDEQVELRVRDRGPGLPESLRARPFRYFERGRAPGDAGGLGLGLALSSQLAREQGGSLVAEAVDDGACLSLRLPLA